jgi:hypothetical protein
MRSVVMVWTRWDDYVLGVRELRSGQELRLGAPPRPLVRCRRGAAWLCESSSCAPAVERALLVGETVTVERDGLKYSVTCWDADDVTMFGAPWRWLMPLGGAAFAGALVAMLTLLFAPRPTSVEHPRAAIPSLHNAPGMAELSDSAPMRLEVFAEAAEPQPRPLKPPGDMQCGRLEAGALIADTHGRYGVSGPKDNADPHLARTVEGTGYPSAMALIPDRELGVTPARLGSDTPTAPFGRDTALGTDEANARGDMWSDPIDDTEGKGGMGLSASPGGVVKLIDVAAVAQGAALRVVHKGLRVDGARKPSEIGRAMAAHFDEFQRCAEAEPLAEARQVQVAFDVAENGHVSTTGGEAGRLEQCLGQSVVRVAFAPEVNARAHVVYPLYFMPATAELRVPSAAPRPPSAPCDCGG